MALCFAEAILLLPPTHEIKVPGGLRVRFDATAPDNIVLAEFIMLPVILVRVSCLGFGGIHAIQAKTVEVCSSS